MSRKEFLIIGLGQFGKNLVSTLYNSDVDLMVIDKDVTKLEEIAGMAVHAVCADASKPEVLNQFEIKSFDGAVVTIGSNLEASVRVIMHLSEMGMPLIIAKATNEFEGRIYRKIGADKVIFPDREIGIRLGKEIAFGNYYDLLNLSDTHSITDLPAPHEWMGQSLIQLNLRKKHGISVIGIRRGEDVMVNPAADEVLQEDDVLIVLGSNADIQAVREV